MGYEFRPPGFGQGIPQATGVIEVAMAQDYAFHLRKGYPKDLGISQQPDSLARVKEYPVAPCLDKGAEAVLAHQVFSPAYVVVTEHGDLHPCNSSDALSISILFSS